MKPILPKKSSSPQITAESLESSFQQMIMPNAANEEKTTKTKHKALKTVENDSNTEGVVAKKKTKKPIVSSKRDGVNRVTLDIPNDLFAQIENHKFETGQTMKFLMVSLLKKFFTEKRNTQQL